MRIALRLARRGLGLTSPNPMVGAVVVRKGVILGTGWHHRAGEAHAEIEAFRDATRNGATLGGATLYVTLEPCSTFGRTPPCTSAIIAHKIGHVVIAATDPNPEHAGAGYTILRAAGLKVTSGVLEAEATELNRIFNHWIVKRTPFVTLKAAMSLDGKIATASGDSKWITSEGARAYAMKLRLAHDAIAVGVNTALSDDPALTVRKGTRILKAPRRVVIDPTGRINRRCRLLTDEYRSKTLVVLSDKASAKAEREIRNQGSEVLRLPFQGDHLDLKRLLRELSLEGVTSILAEGGGETIFSFLRARLGQRICFFYAPKILGGRSARKGVAGEGFPDRTSAPPLRNPRWKKLGQDLLLSADLEHPQST
jgi:diaminohydroxyphosphoribosylaminopyrimidine deaminase/5-amino-6-(5-phosphoribosylamino)uracil reductase